MLLSGKYIKVILPLLRKGLSRPFLRHKKTKDLSKAVNKVSARIEPGYCIDKGAGDGGILSLPRRYSITAACHVCDFCGWGFTLDLNWRIPGLVMGAKLSLSPGAFVLYFCGGAPVLDRDYMPGDHLGNVAQEPGWR